MREITFVCKYKGFLEATGKRDNNESQKEWLNIVALVNTDHHKTIQEEINEAIAMLAEEGNHG